MVHSPRETKEWIKAVAAHLNLSVSSLAQGSGIAPSTLTRYINDSTGKLTVTDRTLDAISGYSGVQKYVQPGNRALPGLGESEAQRYSPEESEPLPEWARAAVAAAKGNKNGVEPWIVRSWALDMAGIIPGDILIIDQNRRPKTGDVVLATITDLVTGSAETVLRIFQPPFLVTHSAKLGACQPEAVDENRVVIMGVRAGLIRPYH